MKYIVTVKKKNKKRAIIIDAPSDMVAKFYVESLIRRKGWTEGEVYSNDSITPLMEDAFILVSACKIVRSNIEWEDRT